MAGPTEETLDGARCNACNESVRAGEPFCSKCGEPVSCRNCGQVLQLGDRFCPLCGVSKTTSFVAGDGGATEISSPWDLILAKLRRATIGEFDIKGEIGRGGMAAVYLAHEVALDRKVAIKVMSPSLLMGQGMAQRFRQEAVTVANLNHQHIITIHAVRQFEDLQYFVMQFVEGCSIETIIKEGGPLPIPAARALLYHVGSGLAHAHAQGVIHRDVKPGNILVGRTGQALVTDFGIAKVLESPSNTQTGMVVGTPAYMSPEQCQTGQVTWRSDQYSLGIVAYEMVAGATPFDGTTLSVVHAQVHDPVPPLMERRADCPSELAQAIHRMLAKDPGERFPSLNEALQALGAMPLLPGDATFQQIAELVGTHQSQASMPTTPVSPQMRRTLDGVATVVSSERAAEAPTTPIPPPLDDSAATRPVAKPGPTITTSPVTRRARRWPWAALLAVIAGGSGAAWYARQRMPAPQPPSVAGLRLLPTATTLTVGDSAVLSAAALDGAGATMRGQDIEWRSRDSAIATINDRGELVAAGIGVTFVIAGAGSHTDSSRVTVTAGAGAVASNTVTPPSQSSRPRGTPNRKALVARVAVSPARITLAPDSSATLRIRAEDAGGRRLSDRTARWTSANSSIATITADGRVTAVAAGTTTIRVSVDSKTASVPVTVSAQPPVLADLAIGDYPAIMVAGTRHDLTAVLTDQRGQPMGGDVSWETSDAAVVGIDTAGQSIAVAPGTAWVVAMAAGLRDSVSVQVAVPTEDQIRAGVQDFLAALSSRDADRVEPVLLTGDEGQRKLAAKLLDKLRGGQWDLQTDTRPREYATRVGDDRAEALFTTELAWKGAFGGRKREDVAFVAVFARVEGEWRLVEVRLEGDTKL
ncbi:MAG: hypothetical protein E2O47_01875 [Gemmatimonadetes bacterium]|nr:MAG: hypothetical protein E2O47_01875 [Gemmatimonadota bacterium]